MNNASILIVDDDNRIRDLLATFFTRHGFFVKKASQCMQARGYINIQTFDLIILDIMMPGEENGLMFAKSLRMQSNIPIILLTAKDELSDRITGLESGADDYVIKPFEPEELLARVRTLLRRTKMVVQNDTVLNYHFGDLKFNMQTYRLLCNNNIEIPLTSTEQLLLKTLSLSPFKAFSRQELTARAGFIVNERTIDVQITRLRKKLKDDVKNPRYIKTIRHIGYALYPDEV